MLTFTELPAVLSCIPLYKNLKLSLESSIQDLPLYDFQIESERPGSEVFQAFQTHPLLPGIILTDRGQREKGESIGDRVEGKFWGIMTRNSFLEYISRQSEREETLKNPIYFLDFLADTEVLILPKDTLIGKAVRQYWQHSPANLYQPIVVEIEPQVYRLLDIHQLLLAQSYIYEMTTQCQTAYQIKAEAEFEKTISLLRGTLEACSDGIIVRQNSDDITTYNQHFVEMWNIPADVIASKNIKKLLPLMLQQLKEPSVFERHALESFCNPDAKSYGVFELKDGRIFECYSQPLRLGRVCSFRDITLFKELGESEERFHQMAENIQEVFWLSDLREPEMYYVSPAYEKVWGFSRESLYEQPESFLKYIHPDDREQAVSLLEKQQQEETMEQELRIISPDGEVRWISNHAFSIKDRSGQPYRVCGVAQDITKRKLAEEALKQAKAELEIRVRERTAELENTVKELEQAQVKIHQSLQKEKEVIDLKARFVSMTSHELRTPLATILIASDLLKSFSHKLSNDKKLRQLDKIQTAVKQMNQLMEDILLFGKAESGMLEFHPTPLNIERFCRDLIEEIELTTDEKHTFSFECHRICSEGACSFFEIDQKLLRHIITNLLSNAVKYSPSGGNIHFNLVCQNQQAIFKIKDEGIGIPETDQEHLFQIFHRASNVSKIPGTGLGLAIIKQAVELHGGTINFESKEGVGTTFTVCVPTSQTKN